LTVLETNIELCKGILALLKGEPRGFYSFSEITQNFSQFTEPEIEKALFDLEFSGVIEGGMTNLLYWYVPILGIFTNGTPPEGLIEFLTEIGEIS
jgi:hypothetical protein